MATKLEGGKALVAGTMKKKNFFCGFPYTRQHTSYPQSRKFCLALRDRATILARLQLGEEETKAHLVHTYRFKRGKK